MEYVVKKFYYISVIEKLFCVVVIIDIQYECYIYVFNFFLFDFFIFEVFLIDVGLIIIKFKFCMVFVW